MKGPRKGMYCYTLLALAPFRNANKQQDSNSIRHSEVSSLARIEFQPQSRLPNLDVVVVMCESHFNKFTLIVDLALSSSTYSTPS